MSKTIYNPYKSTWYKNKEKSKNNRSLPMLYEKRENCCGCTACYAVCPQNAISMEPDAEGFLYPVVDAEKCISCYRCLAVCSFKADQTQKDYISYNKKL